MDKVIGIGEYGIISGLGDRLITHALSTCVAVVFFSEAPRIAAMIHFALPENENPSEEMVKKAYYGNHGLMALMQELQKACKCSLRQMKVYILGGSSSQHNNDIFKIGKRNIEMACRILDEQGIPYNVTEVGGTFSRTVILDLNKGELEIIYQQNVL